jgi:hypothetical protein
VELPADPLKSKSGCHVHPFEEQKKTEYKGKYNKVRSTRKQSNKRLLEIFPEKQIPLSMAKGTNEHIANGRHFPNNDPKGD